MSLRAVVAGLRPSHALKNVPVGAALLFGGRLGDAEAVRATAATFVAFCLTAGAGYLVNDVVDREDDRRHPVRARRPVASGALLPRAALGAAALLGSAGLGLSALAAPWAATAALLAYVGVTLGYTLGLRRLPGVGPVLVAGGFVLRVVAGAGAARVAPSPWLIGLMFVLALALAVAKKEAEVRRTEPSVPRRLRRATDVLLLASGLGYLAYTVSPDTVALHGTRALAWTSIPVAAALVRFRGRLRADAAGAGPAELVARDPVLLGSGLLWLAACAALL